MQHENIHSPLNDLGSFGLLVSALTRKKEDDPDKGAIFPRSDANDLANGAQDIPAEVTDARRSGKKVQFVQQGGPAKWYWLMPGGEKISHNP